MAWSYSKRGNVGRAVGQSSSGAIRYDYKIKAKPYASGVRHHDTGAHTLFWLFSARTPLNSAAGYCPGWVKNVDMLWLRSGTRLLITQYVERVLDRSPTGFESL